MRRVKGVLPIAIQARAMGLDGMLVPTENAAEAAVVDGLKIYPIANLREAAAFLEGREEIEPKQIDIAKLFAVQDIDGRTSPTSRDRNQSSARWRLPRPAGTTC